MGCDIHIVIEEKVGDKWIGIVATDRLKDRPIYAMRDYGFFAEIANVRGRGGHYPKNLPRDVSELAWHLYMRCPTDHHSASHMTIEKFCEIHNSLNPSKSRREHATWDLMGLWPAAEIEDEGASPFRVVFWFDN